MATEVAVLPLKALSWSRPTPWLGWRTLEVGGVAVTGAECSLFPPLPQDGYRKLVRVLPVQEALQNIKSWAFNLKGPKFYIGS
eukprot:1160247-Pelagomonas_calceolata.AAC.27